MKICVIGAGVVGLNTAISLQKEFPTADITILSEKFTTETTSDVAAGVFFPSYKFRGPSDQITSTWASDSYLYWDEIRTSFGSLAGITQLSVFMFSSSSSDDVWDRYMETLLPVYRHATPEELKICPGNWKFGSFYTTLLIECRIYQPWASNRFIELGGKIVSQRINSFAELGGKYDFVVNCSGIGAKHLCSDNKLVPVRSQIIKVKAPWLKTAIFDCDSDTYVIPEFDGIVTLGGIYQYGNDNLNVDKEDSISLRERCNNLVPTLKNALFIREAVGLRPQRDSVRVEIELLDTENGPLTVIHNYGHGSYGVSYSPGTSVYVTKLIRDVHIS